MTDSQQMIVWQASYTPFGMADIAVEAIENNVRFPGQYFDAETGVYYNYFRYYDPGVGRYVTSDPIGLGGGINTYGYVGGNPLFRIDPLGLHFWGVPTGFGHPNSNYSGHSSLRIATVMGFEWLFGYGPKHRYFGPSSNFTKDLMRLSELDQARQHFYSANSDSCLCSGDGAPKSVSTWMGFGLSDYLSGLADQNAARHFLGSFGLSITPNTDGKSARFTATNISSMKSFLYSPKNADFLLWERSSFNFGGNTRQTIEWNEQIFCRNK